MKMTDDEFEQLIRANYPKVRVRKPDGEGCLSDNDITEFAEGLLKGKREKAVISHLIVCEDCREIVRSLQQELPLEEINKIEVPETVAEKAKNLFPSKPRTWEILAKNIKTGLKIITYTGDFCFTYPELERVLLRGKKASRSVGRPNRPEIDYLHPIIPSIEAISPELAQIAAKVSEKKSKLDSIDREIISIRDTKRIQPDQFKILEEKEKEFLSKKEENVKILENLKKVVPRGFFFQEQLWNLTLNILLTRREDGQTYISKLDIGVCDSFAKPQEGIEILLTQGRKVIERFMTQKGISFTKRVDPQKFHIKFRQFGIYLGQAILNLKEETSGSVE
jgi:hypothetical protein